MNIWRRWHVWAGKDHQDPKDGQKNIENFSNHISKGSRSMFARQFDYVPLHCKQSCKTRFENDENLGKVCPEVSERTKEMTLIMYFECKSKPENLQKQLIH